MAPYSLCLMVSCRPHYLPREFSSVFSVAVYIPPQTDAGTKTTLNELYSAISKSDHNSILLVPAYKQKLKQEAQVSQSIKKWSDEADAKLLDWFASTD